ncbi:hypothetical protein, partial [Halalkalibacter flavus]|uniref:hypothetical protein n=1 Tax=Halalkalibacter flavus TaxID=3090668 RepID=UPI002FC6CB0C
SKLAAGRRRAKKARGKCEGAKAFGFYDDEVETLARIRELRRKPRRGRRKTLQEICDILNSEERRPRYGGEWKLNNLSALIVKLKRGTHKVE